MLSPFVLTSVLSAGLLGFRYLSFLHNRHMPAIMLTNSSVHTLIPVLIGNPLFKQLKTLTVIGIHHANGRSSHPEDMHPIIKNTLMTMLSVSSSVLTCAAGFSILHPHFMHMTASSCTSAPQSVQNILVNSPFSILLSNSRKKGFVPRAVIRNLREDIHIVLRLGCALPSEAKRLRRIYTRYEKPTSSFRHSLMQPLLPSCRNGAKPPDASSNA